MKLENGDKTSGPTIIYTIKNSVKSGKCRFYSIFYLAWHAGARRPARASSSFTKTRKLLDMSPNVGCYWYGNNLMTSLKIWPGVFALSFLVGCSTELTPGGANVRQVPLSAANTCTFLGPVTASEAFGLDIAGDTQSAYNKVRNSTAELGGNSFVLSSTSSNADITVVQADAYRC